jgi:hypothetical protein
MTNTIENDLKLLNATIMGTFTFPRIPNNRGKITPFTKNDTDVAEELIQRWYINASKSVGMIRFYAVPEVLKRDGKTRVPLHYHALFAPTNPTRFMEVAPRKWGNLMRHRFPNIRPGTFWIDWIDRGDPHLLESPEKYPFKNTSTDYGWGISHILTDDRLRPDYMNDD